MLQVQLAVGPGGNFVPVDVVIIQAHQNGLFPMHPELGGEPVGRGGFSGGAGTGQHDNSGLPLADHVRNLGKPLFMQGFIHTNQLPDASGLGLSVQVRHRLTFHQLSPMLSLRKDGKEIGTVLECGGLIGRQVVRVQQNEAILGREDIPNGEIAGGGQHFAKEIIRKILVEILVKGF